MPSRRAVVMGAFAASAGFPLQRERRPRLPEDPAKMGAPDDVLRLQRRNIEVNGKPASVYGIRQPDGTFGITTDVGKPFRVRVENSIDEPSLIHWHGLTPPWQQDGVPGISGPADPAGRQRRLRLPAALRRHVLDAFPSGAAGAAPDGGAADHP